MSLVLERGAGGDLAARLRSRGTVRLSEAAARPLLEQLLEAVGALVTGPADDERTDVAPIAPAPLARAISDLDEALAAGGKVLTGGESPEVGLSPTVVLLPGSALHVRLWRDESFAPLRGLAVADDPRHAVALANDTPFGLGAAVFGPHEKAMTVATALKGARITVNEGPLYQDPHLVVGGIGDSGLAGARPKVEQLVFARRTHVAARG